MTLVHSRTTVHRATMVMLRGTDVRWTMGRLGTWEPFRVERQRYGDRSF